MPAVAVDGVGAETAVMSGSAGAEAVSELLQLMVPLDTPFDVITTLPEYVPAEVYEVLMEAPEPEDVVPDGRVHA